MENVYVSRVQLFENQITALQAGLRVLGDIVSDQHLETLDHRTFLRLYSGYTDLCNDFRRRVLRLKLDMKEFVKTVFNSLRIESDERSWYDDIIARLNVQYNALRDIQRTIISECMRISQNIDPQHQWTPDYQRTYYGPWWIEDNEDVTAAVVNMHPDLDLPELSDTRSFIATRDN